MLPYKPSPSVYVHIPFCLEACPYCNFNFRLIRNFDHEFLVDYCQAIVDEWQLYNEKEGPFKTIESIYFGGGTPSLLKPHQIGIIIDKILFSKPKKIEISLEANPDGLLEEKEGLILNEFKQAGVNRLSLGIQSLNDQKLKNLGRNHHVKDVRRVVTEARKKGFINISGDLMGGVPKEDFLSFKKDVHDFLSLELNHISYYSLTLEEKTSYFDRFQKGELSFPKDDQDGEFLRYAREIFEKNGFEGYEISNYAQNGYRSHHNLGYWEYRNYIGLGAGAHSFIKRKGMHERMMNEKNPRKYVQKVQNGVFPHVFREEIVGKKAMGEFVFTGLRKKSGIKLNDFSRIFSLDLKKVFGQEIEELQKINLLHIDQKGNLLLTEKGVFLSDSVFEHFI